MLHFNPFHEYIFKGVLLYQAFLSSKNFSSSKVVGQSVKTFTSKFSKFNLYF